MNLTEFCVWYKSLNYPKNQNPWSGKIFLTDVSSSSIVYAHKNFLVEEYHLFPNCVVPPHSHPFNSITIFLGGNFRGYRVGGSHETYRDYDSKDIGSIGSILMAGHEHGASMGELGSSSLVVSEWLDLNKQNSAAIEWYGPPSGPVHDKLIKEYRK